MQQKALVDAILRPDLELSEKAEMAERIARQRVARPERSESVEVGRAKAAKSGQVN